MARRCAAMCFLMAGCADRSPGQRSYRRVRGFTCIVPGDAAHIARNRSAAVRVISANGSTERLHHAIHCRMSPVLHLDPVL